MKIETTPAVKRFNAAVERDELVEALRLVLRWCVTPEGMPDMGKGRTTEQQDAYDAARAALAKAERGQG